MLRKPCLRGENPCSWTLVERPLVEKDVGGPPRATRWERWDSLPTHEREYRQRLELVHDVASSRCSSRRSPSVADWNGPAAKSEAMPTAGEYVHRDSTNDAGSRRMGPQACGYGFEGFEGVETFQLVDSEAAGLLGCWAAGLRFQRWMNAERKRNRSK